MGAYEHYLAHHGILGQKWGVRRYQNEDGTLTAEGRARYLQEESFGNKKGSILTKEGEKEFFDKKGRMTNDAKEIIKNDPDSDLAKAIKETDFNKRYNSTFIDSYNKAADIFNSKIGEINEKWKGIDTSDWSSENGQKYLMDVGKLWTDSYGEVLIKDYGEHPYHGKEWINRAFMYDTYDSIIEENRKK